jgi:hypothetical protein
MAKQDNTRHPWSKAMEYGKKLAIFKKQLKPIALCFCQDWYTCSNCHTKAKTAECENGKHSPSGGDK